MRRSEDTNKSCGSSTGGRRNRDRVEEKSEAWEVTGKLPPFACPGREQVIWAAVPFRLQGQSVGWSEVGDEPLLHQKVDHEKWETLQDSYSMLLVGGFMAAWICMLLRCGVARDTCESDGLPLILPAFNVANPFIRSRSSSKVDSLPVPIPHTPAPWTCWSASEKVCQA